MQERPLTHSLSQKPCLEGSDPGSIGPKFHKCRSWLRRYFHSDPLGAPAYPGPGLAEPQVSSSWVIQPAPGVCMEFLQIFLPATCFLCLSTPPVSTRQICHLQAQWVFAGSPSLIPGVSLSLYPPAMQNGETPGILSGEIRSQALE